MTWAFLPSPMLGEHYAIAGKAADRSGNVFAELLYDDKAHAVAVVSTGTSFEETSTFSVPVGSTVQFSDTDGGLFISTPHTTRGGGLMRVDWRSGRARWVARYPGFDFPFVRHTFDGEVGVARSSSSDVWLRQGPVERRLTFDGANYSAAMSSAGVLLVSKPAESGELAIWRQGEGGTFQRITAGPADVQPSFSADGALWAYTDYARMSIMLCEVKSASCRTIRTDESLPGWPTLSPDGKMIAYVTQLNRPRLMIISATDGAVQTSWDAHPGCPPVWSSGRTIWMVESASGLFARVERDVAGAPTGRRFTLPSENLEPGEVQCAPKDVSADSPWFRSVDIKKVDRSEVLVRPFR
jgi:hypothetical protein